MQQIRTVIALLLIPFFISGGVVLHKEIHKCVADLVSVSCCSSKVEKPETQHCCSTEKSDTKSESESCLTKDCCYVEHTTIAYSLADFVNSSNGLENSTTFQVVLYQPSQLKREFNPLMEVELRQLNYRHYYPVPSSNGALKWHCRLNC
ncbi:MAG: hypothetical protein KDC92_04520 [Bacteroidetes bacterium]|nr:hypothetical protein [Bacteroidota bacterium]